MSTNWHERATDEEIVECFIRITERRTSIAGYRSQCRTMRKRLYKILYDGLCARQAEASRRRNAA